MDLRKYSGDGSRWFGDCPPIKGLTPILEPLTMEQARFDYEEACEFRDAVTAAQRTDAPADVWYTADDPEWVAWPFERYDIQTRPGPILEPIIERIRDEQDTTRIGAAAQLVRMDTVTELADQIVKWAGRSGLQMAKRFRRCEKPDADIIGVGFALPAFMLSGVDRAMDVTAAEKQWHENDMDERSFVYGWRPEMVARHLAGVDASTTTSYQEGCPPMGPRPEGHSTFAAYVCARAAEALNGPGVDQTLHATADHMGMYRVAAFVHTIRESLEGSEIGRRAAYGHFDEYLGE